MPRTSDKILLISWDTKGGATRVAENLHDQLEEYGVETDVLYHHFGSAPRLVTSKKTQEFSNVDEMLEKADLPRYGVVHSHSCTFEDGQIKKLAEKTNAPLIYTTHSVVLHDILRSKNPEWAKYAEWLGTLNDQDRQRALQEMKTTYPWQGYMFENAHASIQLTEHNADLFRDYYPEHAGKEVVIPNGSDFHKFHDDKSVKKRAEQIRKEIAGNGRIVLYSGRIDPEKGVGELVRAFDLVKGKHPDTKLVIVGQGDMGCISGNVGPNTKDGDIRQIPWVNDRKELAAIYKAAGVTAIPSYHESFSMSALESMMVGTPVIISDVDGVHDAYIKPMLAYDVQPGDADGVAHWINFLWTNPTQARKNADAVRVWVDKNYSLEKVTADTMTLYRKHMVPRIGINSELYANLSPPFRAQNAIERFFNRH